MIYIIKPKYRNMTVQTVQIESVRVPEIRSNAVYTPEKYQEFKESIANSGIQFRPSVRQLADGTYELVDGRHRIRAWQELGHTDIEVEVETLTDEQAFVKHVVANHHRGENDPIGLSKIIKKLRDQGRTYDDIGKMIGYSGSTVSQYATLASLPEVYQQAVSVGQLKLAHIREASRLDDPVDMDAALTYSIQYAWPATTLHHWVEQRVGERSSAGSGAAPGMENTYAVPLPNPDLAQYRTCLVCGAHGIASEMFYPVLGKECHDSLKYLLSIDKNPWNAIQALIEQMTVFQNELAAKDSKIKELSDRLIDLSMQLIPRAQPAPPVHLWPPSFKATAEPRQSIPSSDGSRTPL